MRVCRRVCSTAGLVFCGLWPLLSLLLLSAYRLFAKCASVALKFAI